MVFFPSFGIRMMLVSKYVGDCVLLFSLHFHLTRVTYIALLRVEPRVPKDFFSTLNFQQFVHTCASGEGSLFMHLPLPQH